MSAYKRVENRKYNQDEINYVLARAQAGWDNDTIAKAFKQDNAHYWSNREFTKKQVNYIRSSYNVPWGVVPTYKGPVPQFSKSPTSETRPDLSSKARQKRKQAVRQTQARSQARSSPAQASAVESANNLTPIPNAQHQQLQTPQDVAAGPKIQGQSRASGLMNVANYTNNNMGGLLQKPTNPGRIPFEDPFSIEDFGSGLALGDFGLSNDFSTSDFSNPGLTNNTSQGLGIRHADPRTTVFGQQEVTQQADGGFNYKQGFAGTGARMDHANASMSSYTNFGDSTLSVSGVDPGVELDDNEQASEMSDMSRFLANIPIQSIEHQQPFPAAAQVVQALSGNNTSSDMPGHQQPAQADQPASSILFPPGFTAASAVMRDDHGVWYYDPHDSCHITLGHRHDMDGGVHFSGDLCVTQSLLAMQEKEGIGFLLGLATAQMLQGISQPQRRLQEATEIARGSLPLHMQGQAIVTAPKLETIHRLTEINRLLPENSFYEPFTNQVVQYNLPPVPPSRYGEKGSATRDPSNQGANASGGLAQ